MENEKNYKDLYDIEKKIGTGSFGKVFKAKIKDKEEYVAIKIIDKEKMKENLREQYLTEDIMNEYNKIEKCLNREVDYMKKCSINNINSIKVYNTYNNEEEFVIVMELCDENLMHLLIRKQKFSLSEIYNILMQLNNTFKIMSLNKIAHRDLKLQNILIKYNNKEKTDYTVKITDFGISKVYENNTNFETFTGTLEYIAPEILKGKKYNYKCDLWSLGIIIYMLYFKENPFRGCSQKSIISKLEKMGKNFLKKSGNSIFDNLINGLLEKESKKRFSWKEYLNHSFFQKKPIEVIFKINKSNEKEKLINKKNTNGINIEKVNLDTYENSYSEGSFWEKVKNSGKKIGIKPLYIALLLYYSLSKASLMNKALIIGSLGYFISPIDLIPDYIPFLGLSDDVAFLMFTYYKINSIIDDEIRDNAKKKIKSIFGDDYDKESIEDY